MTDPAERDSENAGPQIPEPTDADRKWADRVRKKATKKQQYELLKAVTQKNLWRADFLLGLPLEEGFFGNSGGLDVDFYDQRLSSSWSWALPMAAERNDTDMVRLLLRHGANIDIGGGSALANAAERGNLELVKYLHSRGCDLEQSGEYALSRAAANGHLDVIKYLVEKNVDISADGHYAMRRARDCGQEHIVRYFSKLIEDKYEDEPKPDAPGDGTVTDTDGRVWAKLNPHTVSVTSTVEGGMSLREVFNFKSCQLMSVFNDDASPAAGATIQNFCDVQNDAGIREAHEKLNGLGGAPRDIEDALLPANRVRKIQVPKSPG